MAPHPTTIDIHYGHRRSDFPETGYDDFLASETRNLKKRLGASSKEIRDAEIYAIVRGAHKSYEYGRDVSAQSWSINNVTIIAGALVACLIAMAVLFHHLTLSPLLYAFPVGLTVVYLILVVLLEFRISRDRVE